MFPKHFSTRPERTASPATSRRQIQSAFDSLDADHNGQIDFAELGEWWVGR